MTETHGNMVCSSVARDPKGLMSKMHGVTGSWLSVFSCPPCLWEHVAGSFVSSNLGQQGKGPLNWTFEGMAHGNAHRGLNHILDAPIPPGHHSVRRFVFLFFFIHHVCVSISKDKVVQQE